MKIEISVGGLGLLGVMWVVGGSSLDQWIYTFYKDFTFGSAGTNANEPSNHELSVVCFIVIWGFTKFFSNRQM